MHPRVALLPVLAVVVAACGTVSPPGASGSSTTAGATTTTLGIAPPTTLPPTTTEVLEPFEVAEGIVVLQCDRRGAFDPLVLQIDLVDPRSGSVLASQTFRETVEFTPLAFCGGGNGPEQALSRSKFSTRFRYMAAWSVRAGTSSGTAAIVDLATGREVVLEGDRATGFSSALPDDKGARFMPPEFSQLVWWDRANRQLLTASSPDWVPEVRSENVDFEPCNPWEPCFAVDLSGEVAEASDYAVLLYEPGGEYVLASGSPFSVTDIDTGVSSAFANPGCVPPLAWLGGQSFVCVDREHQQPAVVTIDSGCESAEYSVLIDALDRTTGSLVPSPDGEWIAFVSFQPGKAGLYVVPASGGEPTLLRELPEPSAASIRAAVMVLDWIPAGGGLATRPGLTCD